MRLRTQFRGKFLRLTTRGYYPSSTYSGLNQVSSSIFFRMRDVRAFKCPESFLIAKEDLGTSIALCEVIVVFGWVLSLRSGRTRWQTVIGDSPMVCHDCQKQRQFSLWPHISLHCHPSFKSLYYR